jgi:hypothetical protein
MSTPRKLPSFAAGGLLYLMSLQAQAGAMSPCSNPTVFDANVQVHIFPFTSEKKLSDKARALATLLQRHVLFAALKYPSIGVEELIDDASPCSFQQVAGRINARLKPEQTAIFLSGRIFEQDGRIYLKNFVSVKTPEGKRAIRWPPGNESQGMTTTQIPTEIDGFAPRTIPVSFLERLEPSQLQARRVHKEPSNESPFTELPDGMRDRYTFLVFEGRDDWMRVRVMPFGIEGWIPAHALASGQELKGEFPELYFVDALVGYFSIPQNAGSNDRLRDLTRRSFDQYLSVTEGRAEPDARALAMVLMGNARLRAAGNEWPTAILSAASKDYERAAAESPTWTTARAHLLASTTLLCARAACENEAATLESKYLDAIARDPLSRELVNGLGAFYQAVSLKQIATELSADALKVRMEKVQAVQAVQARM